MKVPTLGLCTVLLVCSFALAQNVTQPTVNQPITQQRTAMQPTIPGGLLVVQPSATPPYSPSVPVTVSPIAQQVFSPAQPVVGSVSLPRSVATACGCGQQH